MKEIKRTEDLVGLVLTSYAITKDSHNDDDKITLNFSDGNQVIYYHEQDCCENVSIEDIVGSFDDLLNEPLLLAECVSNADYPQRKSEYHDVSFTWTFYKFSTMHGDVTIRWYGESNGYYSESVDMKINGETIYSWS